MCVCVCVCVCVCWDHLRSTLLTSFQYNIIINDDPHAALWVSQAYSFYIIETSRTLTNISLSLMNTLLTISMNLTIWEFTCKWDHAVFVFLCLAHLLQITSSRGLPGGTSDKESTCSTGDPRDAGSFSGSGRSLQEEMATRGSILAWEIPWTEEPGGLQLMGLQWLGHNCAQWLSTVSSRCTHVVAKHRIPSF